MKTMTCKQLGGACDEQFRANSFDEMAALSRKHGMEMIQKGDEPHIKAMNAMNELMQSKEAVMTWMQNKKREFDSLPEEDS